MKFIQSMAIVSGCMVGSSANAQSFGTSGYESPSTLGMFRIQVLPCFRPLVEMLGLPGYDKGNGKFESDLLSVRSSAAHRRRSSCSEYPANVAAVEA